MWFELLFVYIMHPVPVFLSLTTFLTDCVWQGLKGLQTNTFPSDCLRIPYFSYTSMIYHKPARRYPRSLPWFWLMPGFTLETVTKQIIPSNRTWRYLRSTGSSTLPRTMFPIPYKCISPAHSYNLPFISLSQEYVICILQKCRWWSQRRIIRWFFTSADSIDLAYCCIICRFGSSFLHRA